jgi:hypothetical protein
MRLSRDSLVVVSEVKLELRRGCRAPQGYPITSGLILNAAVHLRFIDVMNFAASPTSGPSTFESRRFSHVLDIAQHAGTIGESAARLKHGF